MKNKGKVFISYLSILLILFSMFPSQAFATPDYSDSLKTVDENLNTTNGNGYDAKQDVWILFGDKLPDGEWEVVISEPSGDPVLGAFTAIVDEENRHFNLWDESGSYEDSSIGHGEYKVTVTLEYEDDKDRTQTIRKSDNFFVKSGEIKLTKTASVSQAYPGDTVYYTFKIENKGDFELENIVITDPLLGDEWSLEKESLDKKKSYTFEPVAYTIPEDGTLPLENTATVVAEVKDHPDTTVEDTDSVTIDPYNASIEITKTVDPLYALPGDTVEYTFVVKNTGDEKLYDVVITDPLLGEEWSHTFEGYLKSGKSFDAVTFEYEIPGDFTEFPLENTATVTGEFKVKASSDDSYISHPVSDDDDAVVLLKYPDIQIVKTVDKPAAFPGDTVEYTFTVTNTGTMDLFDITVTDPMFEVFDHTIASLSVGSDPISFTETYTIPEDARFPVENTAFVEGFFEEEEKPVTDDSTATVEEAAPSIEITKTAGQALAFPGDEIEYTLIVTNNGNVDLFSIMVVDEMLGFNENIGSLAAGESSEPIILKYTVPEDATFPIENTATAMGYFKDDESAFVEDDDTAIVEEALPAIQLDKSVSPAFANAGDEVTFSFTITNIGNMDLAEVSVMDAMFGEEWKKELVDLPAGSEPVTFTFNYTIPLDSSFPLTNEALAMGSFDTIKRGFVSDTDTAVVNEKVAQTYALTISKTADKSVIESPDSVTYTIVVTNTGTAPLYNVFVEDQLLAFGDTILLLEPEASQTFTLSKTLTLADRNNGTAVVNTATAFVDVYYSEESPTRLSVSDDATVVVNSAPRDNPPRDNPPTEIVPTDPTPLAAPEVPAVLDNEEVPAEIIEDVVPLDVPVLPQTGELPATLFYGMGGLISGLGIFLKKKNK